MQFTIERTDKVFLSFLARRLAYINCLGAFPCSIGGAGVSELPAPEHFPLPGARVQTGPVSSPALGLFYVATQLPTLQTGYEILKRNVCCEKKRTQGYDDCGPPQQRLTPAHDRRYRYWCWWDPDYAAKLACQANRRCIGCRDPIHLRVDATAEPFPYRIQPAPVADISPPEDCSFWTNPISQ